MKIQSDYNVSQYLLHRLHQFGVNDLFSVGGDYLLNFLEEVLKSPLNLINCCNELGAAYAADGYARIKGLAAIATTFNVGELSAINAIAGSYIENLPSVMIVGVPDRQHQIANRMLHHCLGNYTIARSMYKKITVACELLNDSETAPQQIDKALKRCLFYKKPVYFEIPGDMAREKCIAPQSLTLIKGKTSADALKAAVDESFKLLRKAKSPLFLIGFEIDRHRLTKNVRRLIEATGYPYSTLTTAKTIFSEEHPQFIGCYRGSWNEGYVKEAIETSDCIFMLGGFYADTDMGGIISQAPKNHLIKANFKQTIVKGQVYSSILLKDFIESLNQKFSHKKFSKQQIPINLLKCDKKNYTMRSNRKLTVRRFFQRIETFLKPNDIVIAETGDCLHSLANLKLPKDVTFISQAFYSSIGYSVGATLGVAIASKQRILLFVGDGAFQMLPQEVSTMLRYQLKPIIFLLNNQGYAIERVIKDNKSPNSYNDLQPWRYHLIPQTFGGNSSTIVKTEEDLEKILTLAENAHELIFIEIQIDKYDVSDVLHKIGGVYGGKK